MKLLLQAVTSNPESPQGKEKLLMKNRAFIKNSAKTVATASAANTTSPASATTTTTTSSASTAKDTHDSPHTPLSGSIGRGREELLKALGFKMGPISDSILNDPNNLNLNVTLQVMLEKTDETHGRKPSVKKLLASGSPLIGRYVDQYLDIKLFKNGYAAFIAGSCRTVVSLDKLSDVHYGKKVDRYADITATAERKRKALLAAHYNSDETPDIMEDDDDLNITEEEQAEMDRRETELFVWDNDDGSADDLNDFDEEGDDPDDEDTEEDLGELEEELTDDLDGYADNQKIEPLHGKVVHISNTTICDRHISEVEADVLNRLFKDVNDGVDDAELKPITEFDIDFFMDKPWILRVLISGFDQLEYNQVEKNRGGNKRNQRLARAKAADQDSAMRIEDLVNSNYNMEEIIGRLTPTEQRIALLLQDGYKRPEIAKTLDVSVEAVRNHVYAMRKKLSDMYTPVKTRKTRSDKKSATATEAGEATEATEAEKVVPEAAVSININEYREAAKAVKATKTVTTTVTVTTQVVEA